MFSSQARRYKWYAENQTHFDSLQKAGKLCRALILFLKPFSKWKQQARPSPQFHELSFSQTPADSKQSGS